MVPLVAFMPVTEKLLADKLVTVAFVRVAFVPTKLSVFVVLAFVVDA